MARNYPADTRSQKALEELYEKEIVSQLNWFLKCEKIKQQIGDYLPITPAAIDNVKLPKFKQLFPKLEPQIETESIKPTETKLNEKELDLSSSYMFKPSINTLKLLYDGISEEGKGRLQYLRNRCKLNLEDKFQYPVLNSMEYGWGHSELIANSSAESKKFGRSQIIKDSFYRRTGIPLVHGAEMLGIDKKAF